MDPRRGAVILSLDAETIHELADHLLVTYQLILGHAWRNDGRATAPVTVHALSDERGLSPRSLRRHLAALVRRGYVRQERHPGGGWILRPRHTCQGVKQLWAEPARDGREQRRRNDRERLEARLRRVGVYPRVAQHLAQLPWVNEERVEAWIRQLERSDTVRNLAAVLASTLANRGRCLELSECEEASVHRECLSGGPREEEGREDDYPSSSDLLWQRVLTALRSEWGEERVRVWLHRSRPVSHDESMLLVAVASPMAVDWLMTRELSRIRRTVQHIFGRPMDVRFVAARRGQLAPEVASGNALPEVAGQDRR